MDVALTALFVFAAFAAMHERMIELARRTFLGPPEYNDEQAKADGFGQGFLRRTPEKTPPDAASPSPGLIRRLFKHERWAQARKLLDGATIGPWSVLLGVALAFSTHADAFLLFRRPKDAADASAFFELYLTGWDDYLRWPSGWSHDQRRDVLGCLLMGLSTALGSRFWHDLSQGLVDLRANAKQIPAETKTKIQSPNPGDAVVVASGRAE